MKLVKLLVFTTFIFFGAKLLAQPTAIISGYYSICEGQTTSGSGSLRIDLTGSGPWTFTYSDGTTDFVVNATNSNPHFIYPAPTVTSTYFLKNVSDINGAGTVSGTGSVTVLPKAAPPTITVQDGNETRTCGAQNFILTSNAPTTLWYSDAQCLQQIWSLPNFTTGVFYFSRTIYAKGRYSSYDCLSDPVAVNLTINNTLLAPVIQGAEICGPGNYTLTATIPSGVSGLFWEDLNGNHLGSGASYTGYASASTTIRAYYYTAYPDLCEGHRANVTITVHPSHTPGPYPYNSNDLKVCLPNPITFRMQTGVGYEEGYFKWYNYSGGVYTQISGANNSQYTEPYTQASKFLYVSHIDPVTGCESPKTQMKGTWLSPPSPPSNIQQLTICGETKLTLNIPSSGISDITFGAKWYNPSATNIGSGSSVWIFDNINVPISYSATNTITYSGSFGGYYVCESTPTPIMVNKNYPIAPIVNSVSRCNSGQLILSVANPVSGQTYEWYTSASGGSPVFSGSTYTTPSLSTSTTYYVSALLPLTVSDPNYPSYIECRSPRVPVIATIYTLPTVTAGTSSSTLCSGGSVNLSASGAASYSWSPATGLSNPNIANPTLILTTAGNFTYQVTGTDANECSNVASVTMTVNPNLPVSVSIGVNPSNTICSGTNVTFTASPTNEGTTPSYQWKVDGLNVGTNSSTYSSSTLTDGQVVSCVLTSNATCPTGNPATSDITMTVNSFPVSVSIAASPSNTICSGTNVTFTATPINGGSAPSYQWRVNGGIVGTNSSTYSSSTLTDGKSVTCRLISNLNLNCVTGNPAQSSPLVMTVNPNPTSVNILNLNSSYCVGSPTVTLMGSPSGGTFSLLSGNPDNLIGDTFIPATTGSYSISYVYTDANNCSGSRIKSTSVVNPTPVGVTISANPSTAICPGSNITFTASPTNAGTSPAYQWIKNGADVLDATTSSYTMASLANNDQVACRVTTSLSCRTNNPATSSPFTVLVNNCTNFQALTFDGSNDRAEIPYKTNYNFGLGDFTIEAWVKFNGTQVGAPAIVSNRLSGTDGLLFCTYSGGTQLLIQINGVPNLLSNSFTSIHNNTCNHVAVTRSAGVINFYLNGVAIGSSSRNVSLNNTRSWWIGNDYYNNQPLKGNINEVRIWNIARTTSQISANLTTVFSGSNPNLIGYYRFAEPSGQTIFDGSASINNGFLGSSSISDVNDPIRSSGSCFSGDRIAYTPTEKELIGDDSSSVHLNEEVQIYPNPSSGEFTLLIDGEDKEYNVKVLNLDGKVMYIRKLKSGVVNKFGEELNSGMYILQIINGDEIRNYKLMKQK